MRTNLRKTAALGDVVAAVFDNAAGYSTNPRTVSRLVTRTVALMLRSQRVRTTPSRRPLFNVAEQS